MLGHFSTHLHERIKDLAIIMKGLVRKIASNPYYNQPVRLENSYLELLLSLGIILKCL